MALELSVVYCFVNLIFSVGELKKKLSASLYDKNQIFDRLFNCKFAIFFTGL